MTEANTLAIGDTFHFADLPVHAPLMVRVEDNSRGDIMVERADGLSGWPCAIHTWSKVIPCKEVCNH